MFLGAKKTVYRHTCLSYMSIVLDANTIKRFNVGCSLLICCCREQRGLETWQQIWYQKLLYDIQEKANNQGGLIRLKTGDHLLYWRETIDLPTSEISFLYLQCRPTMYRYGPTSVRPIRPYYEISNAARGLTYLPFQCVSFLQSGKNSKIKKFTSRVKKFVFFGRLRCKIQHGNYDDYGERERL